MEIHVSYHAHLKTGLQHFQSDRPHPKNILFHVPGCSLPLYCSFFELSSCLHFAHSGKAPKLLLCSLLTVVQMPFPSAPLTKQAAVWQREWHIVMFSRIWGLQWLYRGSDENLKWQGKPGKCDNMEYKGKHLGKSNAREGKEAAEEECSRN